MMQLCRVGPRSWRAWRPWAAGRRPGTGRRAAVASRTPPQVAETEPLSPASCHLRHARLILGPRRLRGAAVARCSSAKPGGAGCNAPCGACGPVK